MATRHHHPRKRQLPAVARCWPALLALLLAPAAGGAGLDAVTFGAGPASEYIDVYRFSLVDGFERSWFHSRVGRLTGRWELSLGFWDGRDNDIALLSLSPVWVYEFNARPLGARVYVDLGVGAALLSDKRIDDRELSTNFQFEDRAGIGLRFGSRDQAEISLHAMHYSNADIDTPNNGVNMFITSFVYWINPE